MATEVDRLVVVFDANFARMEEKLNKVIRSNQRAAKEVESSWSADLFKGATAGLPGVEGALGAIAGPAAAAAAAIGAVTLAFQGAIAAVEYADEIGDTADRLHVTTDALQQYRAAIRLAGGETSGADEALESFSQNLGKAKEGLAKSVQAFHAVGIEPAQIKSFKNADEALHAVVKQMEGLSDAEKDAVIQQFGLGGLKQLIDGGADAMDGFLNKTKAAGLVMDAELIARAGELNDEMETAHEIISVQLKSAFVDLAPVIVGLLGLMAKFARAAAEIVDSFRSVENKTTHGLEERQRALIRQVSSLGVKEIAGTIDPSQRSVLRAAEATLAQVNTELAARRADAAKAEAENTETTKTLNAKGKAATKAHAAKPKKAENIKPGDPLLEAIDPNAPATDLERLQYNRSVIERANERTDADLFDFSGMVTPEQMQEAFQKAQDAAQKSLHDGVYSGIRGGLEAGFKDGLPGVLNYLKGALTKSVLDSVAEGLTSAVLTGSKGGSGGLLTSLASALFGPKYAAGTLSSKHGMALVGERGPELVDLPGGSRVFSNAALRNVGMGANRQAAPTIVFDNRGAVIWEQAAQRMMSYADQVAARSGVGAIQVSRRAASGDLARQGGRRLG